MSYIKECLLLSHSEPDLTAERSTTLDPAKLPRHIAIVMDGNGRWATQQGKPRVQGHMEGANSVRTITEECCRLGIEQLTLFCFSSENWKRPRNEVDFLMELLMQFLLSERAIMMRNSVRFRVIGRRDGLSDTVIRQIDETIELTRDNTGTILCLAINYGARSEIVDACQALANKVKDGELEPEAITEELFNEHLYTAGMCDPDLLIRTAGEMRVSNYLLWQISYAELYVTSIAWPDFREASLHDALHDYAQRNRRFGGLNALPNDSD